MPDVEHGEDRHRERPGEGDHCARAHHALATDASREPRREQEAGEGRDRREEQQEAEARRRDPEHVDRDVRRTRHEGVDHADHARAEHQERNVIARSEESPEARPVAQRRASRPMGASRVAQFPGGEQEHGEAEQARQREHRAPVEPLEHEAADRRREHRRDQDRGRGRRQRAGGPRRAEMVEDRRAHDRHRRAAAEGLHHSCRDQRVERLREDGGSAAEHEEPEREQHDRPAAVAVGERRHREVAERDREYRQADEELRRVRRDLHRGRDRRKGRQQDVQAERADRPDDRGCCDQPSACNCSS